VHRTICALVAEAAGQEPTAEPSWPDVKWGYPDGEGVYACGSDFAASGDSAEDRHVEVYFFESNMEPSSDSLCSDEGDKPNALPSEKP
jgi:hypothetical protein